MQVKRYNVLFNLCRLSIQRLSTMSISQELLTEAKLRCKRYQVNSSHGFWQTWLYFELLPTSTHRHATEHHELGGFGSERFPLSSQLHPLAPHIPVEADSHLIDHPLPVSWAFASFVSDALTRSWADLLECCTAKPIKIRGNDFPNMLFRFAINAYSNARTFRNDGKCI